MKQAAIDIDPVRYHNTSRSAETDVRIQIWGYPPFQYEDVQLCMYDRNGTVVASEQIGTIISPKEGFFDEHYHFNVTVSQRPKYITVDHPRLRNDSRFAVELRELAENGGSLTYTSMDKIQDQFAWPRTNETGKCG